MGGQLRVGTPLCIPEKDNMVIGRVTGIEKDKKPVKMGKRGEQVRLRRVFSTDRDSIDRIWGEFDNVAGGLVKADNGMEIVVFEQLRSSCSPHALESYP